METMTDIRELNERIQRESAFVDLLTAEMDKVIVGQKHMVERLMIGLLSNGHILLEGVPGLAKTLAINTLAKCVDAQFSRVQFTPDLLPADLVGTLALAPRRREKGRTVMDIGDAAAQRALWFTPTAVDEEEQLAVAGPGDEREFRRPGVRS